MKYFIKEYVYYMGEYTLALSAREVLKQRTQKSKDYTLAFNTILQ